MILAGKTSSSSPRFIIISWSITGVIVLTLLGLTLGHILLPRVSPAEDGLGEINDGIVLPLLSTTGQMVGITRPVHLKTDIPERPNYKVTEYVVQRGDSVFGIADQFSIKPETVYWANSESFQGAPDTIQVGLKLKIPPVDGVYYQWEEGDTIDSIAEEFGVEQDAIITWPGNNIDLSDPQIKSGVYIMIPGGQKNDQPLFIQTFTRETAGTSSSSCGAGYMGRGYFSWPAGNHYLSGYEWGEDGHRGIDIAGSEGAPVYAADNGVVSMASYGEWNYGYGNVVQIDHGNGFVTIYAHLSVVNVTACSNVTTSTQIGAIGNTGNSLGSHLHFEIRYYNTPVNPWNYLPPP